MEDFMIFLVVFGTSYLYFVRHLEFRTKHSVSESCQQHLCSVMLRCDVLRVLYKEHSR
jgi:hypothetical protein